MKTGKRRRLPNSKILGRFPEETTIPDMALSAFAGALAEGTRVRSLRDDLPGAEITGYFALEGVVTRNPHNPEFGTGDLNTAIVRFDNDPAIPFLPPGGSANDLVWVWPRSDIEVL